MFAALCSPFSCKVNSSHAGSLSSNLSRKNWLNIHEFDFVYSIACIKMRPNIVTAGFCGYQSLVNLWIWKLSNDLETHFEMSHQTLQGLSTDCNFILKPCKSTFADKQFWVVAWVKISTILQFQTIDGMSDWDRKYCLTFLKTKSKPGKSFYLEFAGCNRLP